MLNRLYAVLLLGMLLTFAVPALAQDGEAQELAVYVVPREMNIYELTQELNICIEGLVQTWQPTALSYDFTVGELSPGHRVTYKLGQRPCYDTEGTRIGFRDRTVHFVSDYDGLYSIAQQYNVCVSDLYDANPILRRQTFYNDILDFRDFRYWWFLFIPEVSPCQDTVDTITETISHTMRAGENYHRLSLLYNVCLNRIFEANLHLNLETVENLNRSSFFHFSSEWGVTDEQTGLDMPALQPSMVLNIPINRPPCFYRASGPQRYICYDQPVNFASNYYRQKPPISPIERVEMEKASADNCYPLAYPATPIIYENKLVWRIYSRSMPVEQAANCFGADLTDVYRINNWGNRPNSEYADLWQHVGIGYLIPNATANCGIEDLNDYTNFHNHEMVFTTFPGTLEGRVFTVGEGDTLSAMARHTGYHPQQLKWNNPEIRDVNVIHTYQQIELPPYPSFYHLAGMGAGGIVIFGVSRMYRGRRRDRGKRKK